MITAMNRYQKRKCASGNSISFFVQLYAFYVQNFVHVIVSKITTDEQGDIFQCLMEKSVQCIEVSLFRVDKL